MARYKMEKSTDDPTAYDLIDTQTGKIEVREETWVVVGQLVDSLNRVIPAVGEVEEVADVIRAKAGA